jgi:hypothetical protein
MKILLIITSFCSLFFSCGSGGDGKYGEVVKFSQDKPVKYPDFEITFLGERKQTANFPNGNSFTFTYYDFKVKNPSNEKDLFWTAGTGEIAPAYFTLDGVKFMLELRSAENGKKKLDNDEMVITKM